MKCGECGGNMTSELIEEGTHKRMWYKCKKKHCTGGYIEPLGKSTKQI